MFPLIPGAMVKRKLKRGGGGGGFTFQTKSETAVVNFKQKVCACTSAFMYLCTLFMMTRSNVHGGGAGPFHETCDTSRLSYN